VRRNCISQRTEIRRKQDVVFQDAGYLEVIVEHLAVNLQMTQRATDYTWVIREFSSKCWVDYPGVPEVKIPPIHGTYYFVLDASLGELSNDMRAALRRPGQVDNITMH
jgi:hypothetical protein